MNMLILTFGMLVMPYVEPPRSFKEDPPLFEKGVFSVVKKIDQYTDPARFPRRDQKILMADGINWGFQYLKPEKPGGPFGNEDLTRLAATYYHRNGPFGRVMERYNWFPDRKSNNTFWADVRLPASLVSQGFSQPFIPTSQLVNLWSEPPVAVLGLGAGIPASYVRPLQTMHFYERDEVLIPLSLPKQGNPHFTYILDATKRGGNIKIIPGKERQSLVKKGPRRFYHVMIVEMCTRTFQEKPKVELFTKEGMAACFDCLAEKGILCYHTSNRYYKMPPLIADVAKSLRYAVKRGYDRAPGREPGHFSSEWVLVARRAEYLESVKEPENYAQKMQQDFQQKGWFLPKGKMDYWTIPKATGNHSWTDKSVHKLRGLLISDPTVMMRARRIDQWLRFLTNDQINNWFRSYSYFSVFHNLAEASAKSRIALGQTIEDLP